MSDVNNVELRHTLNKPIHAESDHLHSSLRFPIALSGGEEWDGPGARIHFQGSAFASLLDMCISTVLVHGL